MIVSFDRKQAKVIGLLAVASLAGCSRYSKSPASPVAEAPAPNHWMLLPAGSETFQGRTDYAVWRLDTQTGELALCMYDPGPAQPIIANDKVISAGPSLDCNTSNKP